MKLSEKGFALVELLLAIAITVVICGAAGGTMFQVFRGTERHNDHLIVVSQVQHAGYWISRDAQMAQNVTTEDLTPPDFLILNWTEWDADGEPTYHSAKYFFEDLTDSVGKLKRNHWSSAGASEQTLVAEYIYYDPVDIDDTTQASYQSPVLTVQLTALFEETLETREYKIKHRPNF